MMEPCMHFPMVCYQILILEPSHLHLKSFRVTILQLTYGLQVCKITSAFISFADNIVANISNSFGYVSDFVYGQGSLFVTFSTLANLADTQFVYSYKASSNSFSKLASTQRFSSALDLTSI